MSKHAITLLEKSNTTPWTPVYAGVLQRKCACGNHATGGACEECGKKNLSLQRAIRNPELETRAACRRLSTEF